MLLTPCLCASLVLILPTLISLFMRHSFQIIVPFGWGRVPIVELLLFFGSWSNFFDLCRTLHALNVISSCILCILHFFLCIVSILILLLCLSFVWVKIQNHIKSEKFKKFDCICLSTYHMCVWPSTFVQMTLYIYELSLLCMHIYLCGKNLDIYMWLLWIDFQACHEWLVNSHIGFDTCIDLCLYIFPLFLCFCL